LFVTKVKGAKVGYSMDDESLLNWPRCQQVEQQSYIAEEEEEEEEDVIINK
jgi:hypothetical protein